MGKYYRLIYLLYIILFAVVGFWLDNRYHLTKNESDTISYIANISELLGLFIALTEIFVLNNVTKTIKASIESLQSYSDISTVSIFLSQTKDDLISKKYGKAILRLEKIRDVYQENLPASELNDPASIHRNNYDMLSSIISTLTMAEDSRSGLLSSSNIQEFVRFLTSFNETLISLKLSFKTAIL